MAGSDRGVWPAPGQEGRVPLGGAVHAGHRGVEQEGNGSGDGGVVDIRDAERACGWRHPEIELVPLAVAVEAPMKGLKDAVGLTVSEDRCQDKEQPGPHAKAVQFHFALLCRRKQLSRAASSTNRFG